VFSEIELIPFLFFYSIYDEQTELSNCFFSVSFVGGMFLPVFVIYYIVSVTLVIGVSKYLATLENFASFFLSKDKFMFSHLEKSSNKNSRPSHNSTVVQLSLIYLFIFI
jgi:hypothetical protein